MELNFYLAEAETQCKILRVFTSMGKACKYIPSERHVIWCLSESVRGTRAQQKQFTEGEKQMNIPVLNP